MLRKILIKANTDGRTGKNLITNKTTNQPPGPKKRKKGLRRKAKIPLSIAMVPKAGFEPARVSPPPPQDGVACYSHRRRIRYPQYFHPSMKCRLAHRQEAPAPPSGRTRIAESDTSFGRTFRKARYARGTW